MWTPQTVVPVAPNPKGLELAQAAYKAYGLGWVVSDYRGTQIVAHGGGVPGMVVVLVIVPARDIAFAVFLNSEETNALSAMQYKLLDHYLGVTSPDWTSALVAARQARVAAGREALAADAAEQKKLATSKSKGPSLPLDAYAGRYRDAWYGDAVIERTAAGLAAEPRAQPGARRSARTRPLRYVRGALGGPIARGCVRHVRAECGWLDRPHDDEGRIATRGFQLRLPGSSFQTCAVIACST